MTNKQTLMNLVLLCCIFVRREHLTPEQISRSEEMARKVENGEITEEMLNVSDW